MRWKTTLVLAAVFVALGAFYYLYELRWAPDRERATQAKGRLWTVEGKDVEEVLLRRKGETLHVRREGADWVLVAPVKAKADKNAVDDLVTNLVTARVDREIDPNPAKPEEFGLASPAAEVTLRVKGKSEALTLLLGAKNPTGVWVYAKTGDKPAVFTLSDLVLRAATKAAADFRDRTILAFDRGDVTGLEIALDGGRMTVEREAESKWRITKPVSLRADWEAISDFLDKLRFTRVKEFAAEAPRSLAAYGLERPARVTIFVGKKKDRTAQAILFGKEEPAKQGVYAMRPGDRSVLLVGDDVWKALPKTVGALRDKTVFDYERDKVVRLELESPKGKVALVREGEKWRITAPEPFKADDGEVGGLLFKLREMRAAGFLGEGPGAVDRYLAKPEVKISVGEQDGSATKIKILLLGPSPEKRGGRSMAYAGVVGQGPVVLVDGQYLTDLAKSMTDLRDRTLFAFFDPKDVTRLRVKSGGRLVSLERRGETDWRVTEPKAGKAKEGKVADLLYTLRGLRWKELVSTKGDDAGRYGLDAPSLEVTLYKADGKELGSLVVGRRDADKVYVRTGASPAIFTLDPRQLGDLPKGPEDFQG